MLPGNSFYPRHLEFKCKINAVKEVKNKVNRCTDIALKLKQLIKRFMGRGNSPLLENDSVRTVKPATGYQLVLHFAAVSTIIFGTPYDHAASSLQRCKNGFGRVDVLHIH